jgi:hypothetical protein
MSSIGDNMKHLVMLVLVVMWVMGVVLAHGWWKLLAFVFPFYSWYLVVEQFMMRLGWL